MRQLIATAFFLLTISHGFAQVVTNWAFKTNWIPATANYRSVDGKLMNALVAPWVPISVAPNGTWNPRTGGFVEENWTLLKLNEQPNSLPGLKLFTITQRGRDAFSISNVPLTKREVTISQGVPKPILIAPLTLRVFPLASITNTVAYSDALRINTYDHGVPYTGKIPTVTKRPIYLTNGVQ